MLKLKEYIKILELRKTKKGIPENTPYCYSVKGDFKDYRTLIYTPCVYFTIDKNKGHLCQLEKSEIDDACKVCGISKGY